MTRAFKFVAEQFADGFESGRSIKVGTYSHFRAAEQVAETQWGRGDPTEGLAISKPGPIVGDYASFTEDQRRALRSAGIIATGGKNLRVINNRHTISLPDGYIFCCSTEPDFARAASKGEVVFEIVALRAFASALSEARPDVLRGFRVRRLSYSPRVVDTLTAPIPRPDPFIKDTQWAFEKEVRVAWDPAEKGAPIEPFIILDCPAASEFVRRVTN